MATYEQVVASYYSTPGTDSFVLHSDKIDRELGIPSRAVWRSLGNIVSMTKRARDDAEAKQVLWRTTEQSMLGVEGLKRFAQSQINPFSIYVLERKSRATHAYRLHMGRMLCEALLEQKVPAPEPVNASRLAGSHRLDLVPALRSLESVLKPLVFGSHTATARTAAEQKVADYGFDEAGIATIALKELEPERVLTQMANGDTLDFAADCSLLMSARDISRGMYNLQHTIIDKNT